MRIIPEGFCQCGCGAKTKLAGQADARRGYVKGQPRRVVRGHGPAANITPPPDRFSSKYAVSAGGCWIWTGTLSTGGYGRFSVTTNGKRQEVYAHRWSYEYHVGPIPGGLHIDHLCRNRACVNPAHLEPVTPRENALRGFAPSVVLARANRCKHGHPLTPENTYVRKDNGKRQCRTCKRIRQASYNRAKRERAA